MAQDPYKYFRIEAREILEQLQKGLLDLERGEAAPERVARLLRLAHTIKGAARVVKQGEIADAAHAIEDALTPFRAVATFPSDQVQELLQLLDRIEGRVAALSSPSPAAATSPVAVPDESFRTVRADVHDMDVLLEGVVEAQTQVASLGRAVDVVDRVRQLTELLSTQLGAPSWQRVGGAAAAKTRSMVDEVHDLVGALERDLRVGLEQVDRELKQVRDGTERLRLLPAGLMFNVLERAARDAAQSTGRVVRFEAKGGEVRLDGHVLVMVQNALVQAVRNAVAHGIESGAERAKLGKSSEGLVSLEVARRGNRAAFVCRDDGGGIDLGAIRRAAERKGLPRDEVAQLGAGELLGLLLKGGISTAGAVTEVSGRGIGLDLVRDTTSRLGGEVVVRTEPGQGTTLEMSVPLSLSSLDALVVDVGRRSAAIPLDAVRRTFRVRPADLVRSGESASILVDGALVPFAPLALALTPEASWSEPARGWSAVVIAVDRQVAALGVDRLVGAQNVVLRPLPALTPADGVVAGASLDAGGNPQLLLDPEHLVSIARRARGARIRAPAPRAPILVIDDSMTTRMLERSILESAGYLVEVAASGEEGLEKARRTPFALFLVDVEMPGMDGFTFVERSRADPALADVPAILVTSRAAAEDRERGAAAGAAAYIVKGEFDQTELLARIKALVR